MFNSFRTRISPHAFEKILPFSSTLKSTSPLLEAQTAAVYYRARITDLKTGSLVMNTEPISAANWVLPGNAVVPIGLKLAIEKLEKGSYRLELAASDSMGRESEWRQVRFNIE